MPENPALATVAQGVRNIKTMASLGKVVISSIPDSAVFVTEQLHNGIAFFESTTNILKATSHSFSSAENKEFARLLGVGTDNLMGNAYCRLNAENQIAGSLTTATNYYFKLNLMDWWDNSFKSALGLTLSNHVANYASKSYNKAPTELKDILKRYGIDSHDWKILKDFIKTGEDGRQYIIPSEWTLGQNQINETATKFRTYLKDRVDTGIPTPHAVEKYLATLGTRAGTPLGEAVRMLMQFKQFPITYMMRPLKDYKGSPKTLATMIALATLGGYLSISANKLLNGEEILELNLSTLQESALKGGGLGFYGDFIFGRYNRYGHNIIQSMSGPIFSDIADIFSIYGDLKEGKEEWAINKADSLLRRNIPGRNLFYLAPVLRSSGVSKEWIDKNLNAKNIK